MAACQVFVQRVVLNSIMNRKELQLSARLKHQNPIEISVYKY